MATLPSNDIDRVWRGVMRFWSAAHETVTVRKTELRDAVVATDSWIDANQAAYNSALPAPFRSSATQAQKTLLFCAVAAMRSGLSLLRLIFGEVE